MKNYIQFVVAVSCVLFSVISNAQERVYVSTDKETYLAGEDVWLSVYCADDSHTDKSNLSKVAYLEFYSRAGLVSTIKIALKEGRGCAKFQIPFAFPTGNYSIVSYTKKDGGESVNNFKGKVISIFNTLSNQRVEGGVEIVSANKSVKGSGIPHSGSNALSVDVKNKDGNLDIIPVSIKNISNNDVSFNVSVYNLDGINELVGEWGYNTTSLLNRKGDFKPTPDVDYAGEVIKVRVTPKNGSVESMQGKIVYMSAMGNTDDIYTNEVNKNGEVVFYTNNIYGTRDLVFEVAGDTSKAYNVEIINGAYDHKVADIPVLKISSDMRDALVKRGLGMQIVKRFEADTLYNLMDRRETSFIGTVEPNVYNLDDYTRFPVMEEVIREYVKELRVRKDKGETVLKILWDSDERVLALLDGVPMLDHSAIVKMDPLAIKQIIIYPKKYILNTIVYDGIVKFNTYKNDMAAIKMNKNVVLESHRGVNYPLALLGDNYRGSDNYPNFNNTIYWNPIVNVKSGEEFEFNCVKPQYKGKFKMVVEGVDSQGKEVYASAIFTIE